MWNSVIVGHDLPCGSGGGGTWIGFVLSVRIGRILLDVSGVYVPPAPATSVLSTIDADPALVGGGVGVL
jgi:hypothetical protein